MSPEIRLKKNPLAIKRSLVETLLTLAVVAIVIGGYLQSRTKDLQTFELKYTQLEATGQLLYADTKPDSITFEKATVISITDGDTIKIRRADDTEADIRYIGIDTPEIKHQEAGTDEPYGPQAAAFNSWLVLNKGVYIQKDTAETDKYGRLLRYVYLENGIMVNYALIRQGYATILTVPPNVAFQQQLYSAQELARNEGLGLFKPE